MRCNTHPGYKTSIQYTYRRPLCSASWYRACIYLLAIGLSGGEANCPSFARDNRHIWIYAGFSGGHSEREWIRLEWFLRIYCTAEPPRQAFQTDLFFFFTCLTLLSPILGGVPIIREKSRFNGELPGPVEMDLLEASSASKLLNGVCDLPKLPLPLWPSLLVLPFSTLLQEAMASCMLSFIGPDAGRIWSSRDVAAGPGDGEWNPLVVSTSKRAGVPLPPLEYASACSSHKWSCWELECGCCPSTENMVVEVGSWFSAVSGLDACSMVPRLWPFVNNMGFWSKGRALKETELWSWSAVCICMTSELKCVCSPVWSEVGTSSSMTSVDEACETSQVFSFNWSEHAKGRGASFLVSVISDSFVSWLWFSHGSLTSKIACSFTKSACWACTPLHLTWSLLGLLRSTLSSLVSAQPHQNFKQASFHPSW